MRLLDEAATKTPENFASIKLDVLQSIKDVQEFQIPQQLIFNWDQMELMLFIVPASEIW